MREPLDLFNQWLPFARMIGSSWRVPSVMRGDLIAAAMGGLWRACIKHPELEDPAFEAYVRIRINGAVIDELRAQDWLPRRARERMLKGEEPEVVVVDLEKIREPAHPENEDHPFEEHEEKLAGAISALPDRERDLIVDHYFRGRKLQDIATELRISDPRASQLKRRALQRMRATLTHEPVEKRRELISRR